MAALEIRNDRTPAVLRKLAKETEDTRGARHILAIASALDGMRREDVARSAGIDRQTLRATIDEDEHVAMALDQAGWHGAKALAVPPSITRRACRDHQETGRRVLPAAGQP